MKPIEEGCLAIIQKTTLGISDGTVVTVLKFIGQAPHLTKTSRPDCWRISKAAIWCDGGSFNYLPTKFLLRIDGYEEEEKTEQSDTRIPEPE